MHTVCAQLLGGSLTKVEVVGGSIKGEVLLGQRWFGGLYLVKKGSVSFAVREAHRTASSSAVATTLPSVRSVY